MSGLTLKAFAAAVFAAGSVLLVWAWTSVPVVTGLGFMAFVAGAELLPARMRDHVVASLSSVVVLTAVLVGGWSLGVAASAGIPLMAWRHYPDRLVLRTLFNTGQVALSAGASGIVFELVGGRVGVPESPWSWLALLAAAVVYSVVNHVLIALVIRLEAGESLRSTFVSIATSALALDVFYVGLAVLAAALLLNVGVASVVFLVVPALVARHALLSHERENDAYERLVESLMRAIEVKDGYTRGHTERVATLCVEVARELDFDYEELRAMRYAAKLHDVGKLGVPLSIINKPGPLDDVEFSKIMEHPQLGADILHRIDFLRPILDGVRHHHERVDGGGYPAGLEFEEIPLVARIITVCDAFDAMTSTRPYREAMEVADAFEELDACSGQQFDANVVEVLRRVVDRLDWQPTYAAFEKPDRVRLRAGRTT